MPGETSGPNRINTEALRSVVETSEGFPTNTEVLDSFSNKIGSLQQKVTQLEAQPGVTLDAIEMMQKRREIADTKADLAQAEELWEHLGGKDIDAATELKQELDFKADADDHVVADANVREAKGAFYENFLKEYSNDVKADVTGSTTGVKNIDVEHTTENGTPSSFPKAPEGNKKGFDLDAEIAAAEASTKERADRLVPEVELTLEEKYPKITPSEAELATPLVSLEETRFPTHDEIIARLKESDRWKNASEEERQIYEDVATNEWSAKNAEQNDAAASEMPAEDQSTAESEKDDHFPTHDEVIARLKESDRWKNAPEEERQILEDMATSEWIARKNQRESGESKDRTEDSVEKPAVEASENDEKDNHFPTRDEVLERLRETDKWKNASEEERQIYETEATNRWIAANAEREKSGQHTDGAAEKTAEVSLSPEEKAIQERLMVARNEYARLTAQDRRSFLGRFLQGEGWLSNRLRGVPKIASFMDAINDRFGGAQMKEAIAEFESATRDAMKAAEARLLEEGISPESQEFKEKKIALQIDVDRDLEDKIIEQRHEQSKKAGRFTNWWVRQNRFVKGVTILGIGAAVGAGAGAVAAVAGVAAVPISIFGLWTGTGASYAGALAGGATGFGIARGVSSRRANAQAGDGETIAQQRSRLDRTEKATAISQAEGDTDTALNRLIRVTEQSTSNEMLRNRKRIRTMTGLGMSAGALAGGFTGARLHEYLNSHSTTADGGGSGGDGSNGSESSGGSHAGEGDGLDGAGGDGTGGGTPEVHLDNTFDVEHGSGLIREWDQWASANGHPINRETASQLHQAVLKQFGPDGIIDLKGIGKAAETYIQNGDVRLGAPASAHWRSGVAEFAQRWLETQGKW